MLTLKFVCLSCRTFGLLIPLIEKLEELVAILGVLTTGPEVFPPYILSSVFEYFKLSNSKKFTLLTENQKQEFHKIAFWKTHNNLKQ
jgi:hypothetical protein